MESQAEGSERGTEGELKCLGRASEGPGSVSGAGWTMRAERFPGGHCGNPGCDRGNLGGPERNPGWHRGVFGRKI